MEAVVEIARELNYPGSAKVKQVLRQRGIPFVAAEVDEAIKALTVRQVQAPTYKFQGKIAAPNGLYSRFFADLIDFTAAPSSTNGEKHILVVQDVFSRKIWTEAMIRKTENIDAFQRILGRLDEKVKSCTTDGGSEFTNPAFRSMLEAEGITQHVKDKSDINAIATVDVAIGRLKKALARVSRAKQTDDWASILSDVTRGQNNISNVSYLEGNAPNDVFKNESLVRQLKVKNREFAEGNAERAEKRAKPLETAGRFRSMLSTGGRFTRSFKPKWSSEIHQVERIDGAFVWDTNGNRFLTKFTQPVRGEAETLPPRRIEQGGSAIVEERKQRMLAPFVQMVKTYIAQKTVTLGQVGDFLKNKGFRAAALEARLNMKSPIANFLRAFPDVFDVQGNYVRVLRMDQ